MSEPKPAPMQSLRASRKAVLAGIIGFPILFAVVLLEIAIFVQVVRGRMDINLAIGLTFGAILTGVLGAVPLALKVIDGITREDEAKIAAAAPKAPAVQVAAGEGASATTAIASEPKT